MFLGDRCCILSRRPGRVKALVPVPVPRAQRTWKLFTSDPAFDAIKKHVLELVREEVGGGARPTTEPHAQSSSSPGRSSSRRLLGAWSLAAALAAPARLLPAAADGGARPRRRS